jgi:hypothetical protein
VQESINRLAPLTLPPELPLFVPLHPDSAPQQTALVLGRGAEMELPHKVQLRFDVPPEPDTEVLNPLNVLLNGARGMASMVEVIDVGFDPRTEEIGPRSYANARAAEVLVEHECPPFGSNDRPGGSRIMRTRSNTEWGDREVFHAIPRIG